MRTETLAPTLFLSALLGCEPRMVLPPPSVDAAPRDVLAFDVRPAMPQPDTGIDAQALDGATDDATVDLDGGSSPALDGVVSPGEWDRATSATSTRTDPATEFAADRLSAVHAMLVDGFLYLAVEAQLGAGHALLVYLDTDRGGAHGLLLTATTLQDSIGVLDAALSKTFSPLASTPILLDYAWGTTAMPLGPTAGDDTAGWRDLGATGTSYAPLVGATLSVCGPSACETRIALSPSGFSAPGPVSLFVRLGDTSLDVLSALTLPADDPVAVSLTLDLP